MDSTSILINTVSEIKETVSALNERSKNYYDLLSNQIEISKEHNTRLNKLENKVTALEGFKYLHTKIETMETTIAELKQDKRWMGIITSFVSSIVGAVIVGILVYLLTNH